ncbi:MAG TPA: ACT domain-containing protein, partial [Brachybacterium faecium]|nr:ACT domain-containing protein [Brachybacterium faecium]
TFVLAAREATPREDLTTVSSHPHAQAQVQGWLRSQVPHANIAAASSTAAAARDLAAMSPQEARGRAAVCSPLAAQHFGLEVLAEGIEDHAGAITRFVLVTREGRIPARTGADKTTLVVQLPHNRSGALLEALEILSSNGVNMSRIESRPIGDFLGRYSFSLDIEGHIEDRRVSAALRSLHRLCPVVHYLGSYPRVDGQRPEVREDYADHAYDDARDWVERLHTMITPTDPSTVI